MMDCPIISSAVYPNTRSAAAFQEVTMLSSVLLDNRILGERNDRSQQRASTFVIIRWGFSR